MTVSLIDEYRAFWSPGSKKIELMDEKLIVGVRLAHSHLLLSYILRISGMEAASNKVGFRTSNQPTIYQSDRSVGAKHCGDKYPILTKNLHTAMLAAAQPLR